MKLEKLSAEHIDAVVELEQLCFAHPISADNLERLLLCGIGIGFVITDADRVAAYGGIIIAADEGQILNIATHPSYRRRGLARRIMEEIIATAAEKGTAFITLEVRESNRGAEKLYESLGFTAVGRLKGYYNTPKEDGIIMRLDLKKEDL